MTRLVLARRDALERLVAAGVPDAAADVAALLAHAMGVARADLVLLPPQTELTGDQLARLDAAITARARRQPVAQITGQRLFWGRPFAVTPDVLDPRPETETLVAAALTQPFAHVLDLGTGSGCILLTLAMERPGSRGMGVDLSAAALAVAGRNRKTHGLEGRVVLREGSWYDPVTQRFDLIVSNPPYIAADEMPALAPEVRDWEPHLALTPGGDGLDAYRAIAAGAVDHLVRGGSVLVEIGPTQAVAVSALFTAHGLSGITVLPDLDGRDRVIRAQRP